MIDHKIFRLISAPMLGMALILPTVSMTGCATASYAVKERFGIEKRDILAARVEDAAKAQNAAKKEFTDALDAFRAVVNVDGGELEKKYDKLRGAYDDANDRANKARDRVSAVKTVARDLFKEWERELKDFSDPALRRASERQLEETRARYTILRGKMEAATDSMDPVLAVFKDRVLYLKHNLNARSIAALDGETALLERDVSRLIADMEQSIAAADEFIKQMDG